MSIQTTIVMPKDLKSKTEELRRQHILDAAVEAFAQHGFRGATIRNIASASGVSDGTVYSAFENKEALLMAVLRRLLIASQQTPVSLRADGDLSVFLGEMIAGHWAGLTSETLAMTRVVWSEALINRELGQRYLKEIVQPAMAISSSPLFEEKVKTGVIAEADVPLVLRLIVGSYLGMVLLRLLGDEVLNDSTEHLAQQLADLLKRGIRNEATDGSD